MDDFPQRLETQILLFFQIAFAELMGNTRAPWDPRKMLRTPNLKVL